MTGTGVSPAAQRPEPTPAKFLDVIAPRLQLVEEELRRHFSASRVATIREIGSHILEGGGKRLRPTLLLLISDMLGYKGVKDVIYAAVVEFIHTATLVHDDIIDEAEVRRGLPSINHVWGNEVTVLFGDYFYAYAMEVALREGDLNVLKLLSRATIEMTEGEILGLEMNGRVDLTVDEYFDVVGRKTAALFAATCAIPSCLVGLKETDAKKLFDIGYNLGVGFQLIDDLLDFTSSTEVLGKPALSDLKEGKLTLPLILARPQMTDKDRELVARVAKSKTLEADDAEQILAIVERCDTIEQTRSMAREFIEQAQELLISFPQSEARTALAAALEFVISRDR